MSNSDLTARFEGERLRAQEQSQIVYLQGQIDELRRLLKEQNNRYQLAIEQVRKSEAAMTQLQGLFDKHTDSVNGIADAMRRDMTAVRRDVNAATSRIEEGLRPIRDMQAQMQQLAEARKQDRDVFAGWFERLEAFEKQVASVQSQIKELDERQRQLALQLDRLREADAAVASEIRRTSDEIQVEKQSLRRTAIEAQQYVTDLRSKVEEQVARIDRVEAIRKQLDFLSETLPRQITEMVGRMPDLVTEMKRVERVSTERFLMNQERLEDLRKTTEERLGTLQETEEQHMRQLTSWLERVDGWLREVEGRIKRAVASLEDSQQLQMHRIVELERRELQEAEEMLRSMQDRIVRVRSLQRDVGALEG
jgi:DNA repair exonuclease SbcCD ATPase subunit